MRRTLIFLLATAVLSGCGYQLRGDTSLPDNVRVVAVSVPSVPFFDELSSYLTNADVKVIQGTGGKDVDAVIRIDAEDFDRRLLTVDPNTGKAREYELAYSFDFEVRDRDGKQLVARQSIRLLRDLVFDSDAVIGHSREEGVLREEMRRDGIQQLVRRLQASLGR